MKELNIIIRPEMLEKVKQILNRYGCGGLTIYNVMGCGTQRGLDKPISSSMKGVHEYINLIPKIKVECVMEDEAVDKITDSIQKELSTGKVGDGKMFIKPVENAIRIRTGEQGDLAL